MGLRPGVNTKAMDAHRRSFSSDRPVTLKAGKNVWRFVRGPTIVNVHWVPIVVQSSEGELIKISSRIVCPIGNEAAPEAEECVLCAVAAAETAVLDGKKRSTLATSTEYLFAIIDREDQKKTGATVLKKARVPWSVYKKMEKLFEDPNYGMWCEYDLTMTKTERKNQPADFDTMPAREDSYFTEQEIYAIATCTIDIEKDTVPLSGKHMRQALIDNPIDLSREDKFRHPEVVRYQLDEEGLPYLGGDSIGKEPEEPKRKSSTFTSSSKFRPKGAKRKKIGGFVSRGEWGGLEPSDEELF